MRRKLFVLLVTFVCSVGIVVVLFLNSERINSNSNNFVRRLPPHIIGLKKHIPLKKLTFYFAGSSKSEIYLACRERINFYIKIDLNTLGSEMTNFTIVNGENMRFRSPFLFVDSTILQIADGSIPLILESKKSSTLNFRPKPLGHNYFDQIQKISSCSYVLRTIDKKDGFVLIKKSMGSLDSTAIKNPLEKQGDRFISKDGVLLYASEQKRAIYTYYYRNRYVVMDTNLKVLNFGRTIDTVSIARLSLENLNSSNEIKLARPAVPVNKKSAISGHYLFINSSLKADNEADENFRNAAVIDVYDIRNVKYVLSFYIPDYHGQRMKEFKVVKDRLYVIYEKDFCQYEVASNYLK